MDGRLPVTPTRVWVADIKKPRTSPARGNIGDEMREHFGLADDAPALNDVTRNDVTHTVKTPSVTKTTPVRAHAPKVEQRIEVSPLNATRNVLAQQRSGSAPVQSMPSVQTHTTSASMPSVQTPSVQTNTQSVQATDRTAVIQPPGTYTTRYTNEEISEMLSNGYINITKEMWPFLPVGSHVRFFKKGPGTKYERFRPGGFIKRQYLTTEGKRILLMETICGGSGAPGYMTYPMAIDDLDEIWKRYPEDCFVEIHLIHNSLAHKDKLIRELSARVTALESRIKK